ncbi:MAG: right-handed parallel beta-helix repeat-containing protein [Pseudomonadota bacterium]
MSQIRPCGFLKIAAASSLTIALAWSGRANADAFIHVSPSGNDLHTGANATAPSTGTGGPVKTLAAAQKLARLQLSAMKLGTKAREPVRVVVQPGWYVLGAPLAFTPDDSGTAAAPVIYEAATPGTAVISGGVGLAALLSTGPYARFQAPNNNIDHIKAAGQLFVNARRATLARMPNEGQYYFVSKPVPLASEPVTASGHHAFVPFDNALPFLNGLSAADKARAVVGVMASWTASRQRFATVAPPPGAVQLMPRSSQAFLSHGLSQRFFVENVPSALDAAGEWIWDGAEIRYLPRTQDSGTPMDAVVPMLDRLVSIKGTALSFVEHLQFKGLAFRYQRSVAPPGGYVDGQGAFWIPAAIEADLARALLFESIEVSRTGGAGIWLRNGVRNSTITGSLFNDLGAGAIKIGENTSGGLTEQTGANRIVGNRINEIGKVYPGGVGVIIAQSFDNEVSYNQISNTAYTGISLGWSWGYGTPTSGRNQVVGNLLFNIGQSVLSDLGAIYAVGISPGTVIAENLVREVRGYGGYGAGAWGIYLDEGGSQIEVKNNVVVDTDSGGFHLNFGRANYVRDNVFARGVQSELAITRSDPLQTKLDYRNNLVIPNTPRPMTKFAVSPDVIFTANLVSGAEARSALDISQCGAGCAASGATLSTSASPADVVLGNADATTVAMVNRVAARAGRLPPTSTVLPPPGYHAIDGLGVTTAAVAVAAEAPPVALAIDLDTMAAGGTRPAGLAYHPATDLAAVRVVGEAAAPGGKCLLFDDSARFAFRYEPYVSMAMSYMSGPVLGQFSLRFDASAVMVHEWRDDASPYLTGPAFKIAAGGVHINNVNVASLMPGAWYGFRTEVASMGGATTWKLTVTDAAGTARVFGNLPFKSAGFKKLKWMGFISDTANVSQFCMANIRVGPG